MLDYPDTVKAAFIHRHGDGKNLSGTQRMNLRHDVAKGLLAGNYSHLGDELDKKALDQHNMANNEWSLILDDVSFADDIPQYVFSSPPHPVNSRSHL